MERAYGLMLTLPSALLIGVCVVLVLHRMIDGRLPALPGFVAICFLFVALYLCAQPPTPEFPFLVWVVVLALFLTYPFAESQLEKIELREIEVERMEKAFGALQMRPDNYSAQFEVARCLYKQGFPIDAIAVADNTMARLSEKRDEVRNTSLKDVFRVEAILLQKWKTTPVEHPPQEVYTCKACNTKNPPGTLFCTGCKRPYLLDRVRAIDPRARFVGKLVFTWALIGTSIVVGAAIGMSMQGSMRFVVIAGFLAVVGVLLSLLFRIKRPGAKVEESRPLYQAEG